MQEEYYESPEESEARFEHELERLENEPSYMSVSWEKFTVNPTDIGAKCLWLKYSKKGQSIPREVMERMIRIIEDDIEQYQFGADKGRSLPGSLTKQEQEEPVYALLHCAKENPDHFWQILHESSPDDSSVFLPIQSFYPDSLLEKLRAEFPNKRRLTSEELYEVFGKLLGLVFEESGSGVGERMRLRYTKTYKKNLKRRNELYERFKP
ncbi:hypothetical protein [Desulfocastanea catecholica]